MKKFAFTLSEVLITLTVIGVVAAITLPPLIQNYQKMVLVNQLKKSYSILSQAIQKMMADDGVNNWNDTEFVRVLKNKDCSTLQGYFKNINGEYKGDLLDFKKNTSSYFFSFMNEAFACQFQMDNGAYFAINKGGIGIDVNGRQKGPNIAGRDIFVFTIQENGKLNPQDYYATKCEYNGGKGTCYDVFYGGAARIMENGWKMDY